jgi:hypothetical protein
VVFSSLEMNRTRQGAEGWKGGVIVTKKVAKVTWLAVPYLPIHFGTNSP